MKTYQPFGSYSATMLLICNTAKFLMLVLPLTSICAFSQPKSKTSDDLKHIRQISLVFSRAEEELKTQGSLGYTTLTDLRTIESLQSMWHCRRLLNNFGFIKEVRCESLPANAAKIVQRSGEAAAAYYKNNFSSMAAKAFEQAHNNLEDLFTVALTYRHTEGGQRAVWKLIHGLSGRKHWLPAAFFLEAYLRFHPPSTLSNEELATAMYIFVKGSLGKRYVEVRDTLSARKNSEESDVTLAGNVMSIDEAIAFSLAAATGEKAPLGPKGKAISTEPRQELGTWARRSERLIWLVRALGFSGDLGPFKQRFDIRLRSRVDMNVLEGLPEIYNRLLAEDQNNPALMYVDDYNLMLDLLIGLGDRQALEEVFRFPSPIAILWGSRTLEWDHSKEMVVKVEKAFSSDKETFCKHYAGLDDYSRIRIANFWILGIHKKLCSSAEK